MTVHQFPSSRASTGCVQPSEKLFSPSPDTGARKSGTNLYEQLARDALCSAEPEPLKERIKDGIFYALLGAMAATVLGLLVLWAQS